MFFCSNNITKSFSKFLCLCTITICSINAEAAKKKQVKNTRCTTATLDGRTIPCVKSTPTSLVVDAKTGKVLHAENAHTLIDPASTSKLITLYMLFDAVDRGVVSLDQKITVSQKAQNMPPLKLGLKAGSKITFLDAAKAMIVRSANDAAVAVGEALYGGSEAKFAAAATKKMSQLGMSSTTVKNASGWYVSEHKTTAMDLARIAIALRRDFPQYYPLFSLTEYTTPEGRVIRSHNHIVANYQGAEGMKTGFNNPAGSCIVTTASRNNKHLVAVVTGSPSGSSRNMKVTSLLNKHFGSPAKTSVTRLASSKKLYKKNSTKPRVILSHRNSKHKAV